MAEAQPNWVLVRWIDADGARGECRVKLAQLPLAFGLLSHPDVAAGQELLVEAMTVTEQEARIDLRPPGHHPGAWTMPK